MTADRPWNDGRWRRQDGQEIDLARCIKDWDQLSENAQEAVIAVCALYRMETIGWGIPPEVRDRISRYGRAWSEEDAADQ